MNIIPERKYGKIGFMNNMDILIKVNINSSLYKNNNNKIINIIFDNSISSIGKCFLKLKKGINKFVALIPSEYIIIIYSNQKEVYFGNNKIIDIIDSLNKVECCGFNNYQKYLDLKLENCVLFTDEELESNEFMNVISVNKCLDIDFLNLIMKRIINNLGDCIIKLYPLNNCFIKKIYYQDNFNLIKISNIIKNKEYNILINIDILSFNSIVQDILEVNLFLENKLLYQNKYKMLFIKENNFINKEVLIQRIIKDGNLLEKKIKKLYQEKNLFQIKNILYKLKDIYNFGKNSLLCTKYQKVTDCILYIEEELSSESLKSLELNYEMKVNQFDLDK